MYLESASKVDNYLHGCEDDIFDRKLLEKTFLEQKRLTIMLLDLVKWCKKNMDQNTKRKIDFDRISRLLSNCDTAVDKSQKVLSLNQDELSMYRKLYQRMEEGIRLAEQRIRHCDRILFDKRSWSPVHVCASAKEAKQREELASTLVQLDNELKKLQLVREDLRCKLEKRQKQFQNLMFNAQQLQSLLRREEASIRNSMKSMLKKRIKPNLTKISCSSNTGCISQNFQQVHSPTMHVAQVELVKHQPFVNILQRPSISTRITLFRPQTDYMILS